MKPRLSRPARAAFQELSERSQAIYRDLATTYAIHDAGGIQVLLSGLKSLDEAFACEAQIDTDGRVIRDRWGQPKAHPLCAVARDARSAWQAALRSLNLAIGTPPKTGRPEG